MLMMTGLITQHMIAHIVAMNMVAPVVALFAQRNRLIWRKASSSIGAATAVQLALLWGWHLPVPMAYATASAEGMLLMHTSLFLAALWFWASVVDAAIRTGWRALAALLVTGKIFCLLGVIIVFAPRPLYPTMPLHTQRGQFADPALQLADQQLAGLLMLIVCPLTYVLAAIVIAAYWLSYIDRHPGWTHRAAPHLQDPL
ncbi:cytochrome c oxidase assembly protein [Chelativorans xinjiangense]|uniref:cytochrome c oxidase assembly protein n=1 Tax=Chelativorans xinjiangense TaxID=2681485 RepID=UPI001358E7CE|nr:cytochrome c oxidase assembly protein [Chelativorans xinjiangense]